MSYQEIIYEVENRVATITLNRPESLNAFTEVMLSEWTEALQRAQRDENVWVVVVTGPALRGYPVFRDIVRSAIGSIHHQISLSMKERSCMDIDLKHGLCIKESHCV